MMSQSHALGWQAASGQPGDVMAAMLNYDVIAKIPTTTSLDAYLLEEQSDQISSRSNLKQRSLCAQTRTRRVAIWVQYGTFVVPQELFLGHSPFLNDGFVLRAVQSHVRV